LKVTIVGIGKVGMETAKRLYEEGHDIVVIDKDEAKLAKIHEELDIMAIKGNGSSAYVLKNPDIIDSNLLVAVTNSDELNMVSCMTAKNLGIPKTVARVRDPDYVRDLAVSKEGLGIDLIVNPEYAAAVEVSRLLMMALPVHIEPFANGKVQMAEIHIEEKLEGFVNKKLKELDLPQPSLIVAISRKGEVIVPGGYDMIQPGDTLYVLAHPWGINKICSRIKKKRQRVHSVMILGGSRLAYYLAERLGAVGIRVKIIEQNKERCQELAERLPDALILKGDGSDVELLRREGIKETDGFVAVTGIDEENLLVSLLAKQMGAKRVIAKVSRPSYAQLVERLGVDAAISPRLITVSEILRFIRGGRLLSLFLLLNEKAEVMELIVQTGCRMINKQLNKSDLPGGVIIGAIMRDNKTIIPEGNEVIMDGDRLVVFTLGHNIHNVEALFNAGG